MIDHQVAEPLDDRGGSNRPNAYKLSTIRTVLTSYFIQMKRERQRR